MNISIPIYIERQADRLFFRPLFSPEPEAVHRHMERGMGSLSGKIRRFLNDLNGKTRHDELADFLFQPDFQDKTLDFRIPAGKKSVRTRLLYILIRHGDRHLVYVPALNGLWFDLMRGEDLKDRAYEAVGDYVREAMRVDSGEGAAFDPGVELDKKAWVMHLDLDFAPKIVPRIEADDSMSFFAMIGDMGKMDGREELEETGRCLNRQYPDGLGRAFLRDRELEEFEKVLEDGRRRPILLIGPPQAGKTAICHEYLRRRIERTNEAKGRKPLSFWLLSPQRLISGMSYVGQWEERVLAILKHAAKKRIVLMFDDLLGLYRAGVSSSSSLSVADVLKPFAIRREVSILAETTPEAFRAFQELDRGFADQFHLLPVRETASDDTLTILIRTMRELEGRHWCKFHPAVLPLVVDLQRRYARRLAFPGKAVLFMEQLASRFEKKEIAPGDALDEFHKKSGLSLSILDDRVRLTKSDVEEELRKAVVGQESAVAAMAEAVSIAKARLNDPSRPLASFLFLGPTGVGKTHCAKALAANLFGSEEKLLRFDMNEYVEADSVSRLTGTFYQPQGLLTNAVNHSPFSVILLDEIEKAHPDVFNLLLQVLDDGRLTDALGRTSDFTNAIIVMTSNLGARESGKSTGYMETGKEARAAKYIRAAESFFRPEFFNRLDRIIPFSHLEKKEIESIGKKVLEAVFRREGLARRKSLLDIHPDIVAEVAREGYHPELGARALKREIERTVARPAAAHLAGINPGKASVVAIDRQDGKIRVLVRELGEAEKVHWPLLAMTEDEALERIGRMESFFERISADLSSFRPRHGVNADNLLPEHEFYFEVSDRMARLRKRVERFLDSRARLAPPVRQLHTQLKFRPSKRKLWKYGDQRHVSQNELIAVGQLSEYLQSLEAEGKPIAAEQGGPARMIFDGADLNALVEAGPERIHQSVTILFRVFGDPVVLESVRNMVKSVGEKPLCWEIDEKSETEMRIEGPLAYDMLRIEQGGHLFTGRHGGFSMVALSLCHEPLPALSKETSPFSLPLSASSSGNLAVEKEDTPYPKIIRIYDAQGIVYDLLSGMTLKSQYPSGEEYRMLLTGRLPLPKELE